MSELYTDTSRSISPRYYDQQSIRIHFDDESRRVEEIIEEEKKIETAKEEESRRIEDEKLLKELYYAEEIEKKNLELRDREADEENLERIRKASVSEVERWLDFERIKQLEQLQLERENQILEELDRKRREEKSAAEQLSEYLQHDSDYSGMNINYFA